MWRVYYYQDRRGGPTFPALQWVAGTVAGIHSKVTLPDGTTTLAQDGEWCVWDSEAGVYRMWVSQKFHERFQEAPVLGKIKPWRPWEILENV